MRGRVCVTRRSGGAVCTSCRELEAGCKKAAESCFKKEDHEKRTIEEREETAPVAANKICCRRRGVECNRLLNGLVYFG